MKLFGNRKRDLWSRRGLFFTLFDVGPLIKDSVRYRSCERYSRPEILVENSVAFDWPVCSSTAAFIDKKATTFSFVFFHTGRATWTRHVRNGKELPEIIRDNYYDFNFQV